MGMTRGQRDELLPQNHTAFSFSILLVLAFLNRKSHSSGGGIADGDLERIPPEPGLVPQANGQGVDLFTLLLGMKPLLISTSIFSIIDP
jgi:hypothetical protein